MPRSMNTLLTDEADDKSWVLSIAEEQDVSAKDVPSPKARYGGWKRGLEK